MNNCGDSYRAGLSDAELYAAEWASRTRWTEESGSGFDGHKQSQGITASVQARLISTWGGFFFANHLLWTHDKIGLSRVTSRVVKSPKRTGNRNKELPWTFGLVIVRGHRPSRHVKLDMIQGTMSSCDSKHYWSYLHT